VRRKLNKRTTRESQWKRGEGGIEGWKGDSELGIVRLQLLVVFLFFFFLFLPGKALLEGGEKEIN